MGNRRIFISTKTTGIVHSFSGNRQDHSSVLNQLAVAAEWLSVVDIPLFNKKEWEEIFTTYENREFLSVHPYNIAADMMEHRNALSPKHHRAPELVMRVFKLSQADQFSTLCVVQRFYAASGITNLSHSLGEAADWEIDDVESYKKKYRSPHG